MKKYYILLSILAVLAWISLSPDAVVTGLFYFIFPGLILLVSGTAFAYTLAILPAIHVFRATRRASVAAAIGLLCVLLIAALPSIISRHSFGEFARTILASDFEKPPAIHPKSFEFPARAG